MKRMQNQAKSASKRTWREKGTYVKKNWQLYLFFLMPGLLLTIIFKYLPMGGLLIAFEDYNVIKGVLGSPWVGLEYLRIAVGVPGSNYSCIASESYSKDRNQEEGSAFDLYAELYFRHRTLWYGPYVFIACRTAE